MLQVTWTIVSTATLMRLDVLLETKYFRFFCLHDHELKFFSIRSLTNSKMGVNFSMSSRSKNSL